MLVLIGYLRVLRYLEGYWKKVAGVGWILQVIELVLTLGRTTWAARDWSQFVLGIISNARSFGRTFIVKACYSELGKPRFPNMSVEQAELNFR